MGANWQSLRHLSCTVPQPAEIVSLRAKWCISQVRREVALVQHTRNMAAECMDWFMAVLEAHQLHLEMMAHLQWIAEGGTFEVNHNLLGENYKLATMAHNSDIVGLHQSLSVTLVSCWIGHGGRTVEHLQMVAAKLVNNTLEVNEIDLGVARIECPYSVYFQHYDPMLYLVIWALL